MPAHSGRIPSLDGLRALAVLLVVYGHAMRTRGFPPAPRQWVFMDFGYFGVRIFFILSGFLITTLLAQELRRTGTVSLSDFYKRRTIRIFPAAYLYIGVVALVATFGGVSLQAGDLLHALTYTVNYHPQRAWALGHLWSLGVEEQFYLLWPLTFLMLGERRSLWAAAAVIAFVPALRVLTWLTLPSARIGIDEQFQLVCDALATGCLLALIIARYGLARTIRTVPGWVMLLAPFAALVASMLQSRPSVYLPIGATLANVSIALVLLWCMSHAQSGVGRVLNSRPVIFLGTISYSLYLWQQLFMDRTLADDRLFFPVNVLLALAFAAGSFYLVERPLLALRRRYRH
jgi:peptidoglycan/LPS O-acetylase OafA/YrhL